LADRSKASRTRTGSSCAFGATGRRGEHTSEQHGNGFARDATAAHHDLLLSQA
jgi:hypothetical protein